MHTPETSHPSLKLHPPELLNISLMSSAVSNPLDLNEECITEYVTEIDFDVEVQVEAGVFACMLFVHLQSYSEGVEQEEVKAQFTFALIYAVEAIEAYLDQDKLAAGEHQFTAEAFDALAMSSQHLVRGMLPAYLQRTHLQDVLLPMRTASEMRITDSSE